ncbi:MAG: hypothetical protein ACKVOO_05395 [Burkholderiaceae bacterium]
MNIQRILAQISPALIGTSSTAPVLAVHGGDTAMPTTPAQLMEQANAMAGRNPSQARQLRLGALAMLSVVR